MPRDGPIEWFNVNSKQALFRERRPNIQNPKKENNKKKSKVEVAHTHNIYGCFSSDLERERERREFFTSRARERERERRKEGIFLRRRKRECWLLLAEEPLSLSLVLAQVRVD
jgi:hypothetical protein